MLILSKLKTVINRGSTRQGFLGYRGRMHSNPGSLRQWLSACGPDNLDGSVTIGIRARLRVSTWIICNITFKNFKRVLQIKGISRKKNLKHFLCLSSCLLQVSGKDFWWFKSRTSREFQLLNNLKNQASPRMFCEVLSNILSFAER